ncbi:MAG TPA: alpha/beta hydrolase [Candidatus Binatia bacterium]|nr:alpha/beta hydrolase [Candidatus Binatia bacterium]
MADRWKHDFVEANGIRFHYVTAGEGPLVLLLHGFPQFWYAWRHQVPVLAERFKVVAPDLRGYGDTEKPPRVADYRTGILAADVAALVGAFGCEKAHIVGHDWGGGVAWATALEYAAVVDRLVVLNCPHPILFAKALRSNLRQLARSWYMFFFQLPAIPELVFRLAPRRLVERVFRRMAIRPGTFSDEDLHQFKEALEKPGVLTSAINYYRATFRNLSVIRELERSPTTISCPTLLIWGENDVALGKELTYGMERLFTGPFRIHYVPNCSHWVNEEQPDLVNRLLLDFLAARESA